ncbi:hypothetical protein [Dehalococcoides mccartyi]
MVGVVRWRWRGLAAGGQTKTAKEQKTEG